MVEFVFAMLWIQFSLRNPSAVLVYQGFMALVVNLMIVHKIQISAKMEVFVRLHSMERRFVLVLANFKENIVMNQKLATSIV
jgi:hypothetical protein